MYMTIKKRIMLKRQLERLTGTEVEWYMQVAEKKAIKYETRQDGIMGAKKKDGRK